jgi:hypothetical protein
MLQNDGLMAAYDGVERLCKQKKWDAPSYSQPEGSGVAQSGGNSQKKASASQYGGNIR